MLGPIEGAPPLIFVLGVLSVLVLPALTVSVGGTALAAGRCWRRGCAGATTPSGWRSPRRDD